MVASLQYGAKCPCGYCHISDVESHKQDDHMESFFLAETVKYLWLLFDLAAGPENIVENGPYKYVFSTEGHILPATPQISLVREHCSYLGSFCSVGDGKSPRLNVVSSAGETNKSKHYGVLSSAGLYSSSHFRPAPFPELLKGRCPGLTYEQRYGISFTSPASISGGQDTSRESQDPKVVTSQTDVSTNQNDDEYSLSAAQTSTES